MHLAAVVLLFARKLPALFAVRALVGVALLVSLPFVGAVLLVERLDLCRARALFLRLPAQRIQIFNRALGFLINSSGDAETLPVSRSLTFFPSLATAALNPQTSAMIIRIKTSPIVRAPFSYSSSRIFLRFC